jgi:nicotinamidase-related amidase
VVEGLKAEQERLTKAGKGLTVKKGLSPEVDSYSCFFDVKKDREVTLDDGKTTLAAQLKKWGAKTLYFCGVATDYCVGSSVADAISEKVGWDPKEVYLVSDAVRAVAPADGEKKIAELEGKGVKTITSDQVKWSVGWSVPFCRVVVTVRRWHGQRPSVVSSAAASRVSSRRGSA